ncbi:hypothetical protein ILYODFUR_013059 [Ilyodon furcidens]|uniref:Uncharacterized protein n=1 Tax=Ilyodon furcidens TaxID=33524 RepID=A0ABV0SY05_9TELE
MKRREGNLAGSQNQVFCDGDGKKEKEEDVKGLGRHDNIKLKLAEATESEEKQKEGDGVQVDNKLNIRSAALPASLSICQEMRAEQQAAKTHRRLLGKIFPPENQTGGEKLSCSHVGADA